MRVDASCNRIPTLDGHLENVWADTTEPVDAHAATAALEGYPALDLPSSPDQLVTVFEEPDRPQPRLDRDRDRGMGVGVGGLQTTDGGVQFNCLAHNTVRGAAGASVLNGELLLDRGYL
jgi:aspartate-semialdehyde dehydrogenase